MAAAVNGWRVLDHAPHAWFLFGAQDEVYLDIHCSHGAAGYSVLVPLDAQETRAWQDEGRTFLDRLAQAVQDAGPGSPYQSRDVGAQFAVATSAALAAWRLTPPESSR
jgi:hypothetical protein